MTSLPLVSVIIPCYNAENFVESAVRSIMDQTYSNLEIIVIDDCSTDNTPKILEKLAGEDSRIIYIRNESNLKLVRTLNKGLRLCQGEYIARMDADDISKKGRIEKQLTFMQTHPNIDVTGCAIEVFGEGLKRHIALNPLDHKHILAQLFVKSSFFHPTVFFSRRLIESNKYIYDEKFYRIEDYALWVKLANDGVVFANLSDVLLEYRILPHSETRLSEKENHSVRVNYLSRIHSQMVGLTNVELTEEEQRQYSIATDRALFSLIDINILAKGYKKFYKSSESNLVIKELSMRWIAVLFLAKHIPWPVRLRKAMMTKLTFYGVVQYVISLMGIK